MINIAVCEDDVFLGGQIETMLYRQAETEGVEIQTEVFTSAENCLKYLKEECMVDLLFLDIELESNLQKGFAMNCTMIICRLYLFPQNSRMLWNYLKAIRCIFW